MWTGKFVLMGRGRKQKACPFKGSGKIFQEIEWHDSYLYWQILKRVAPNEGYDIGIMTEGNVAPHVFINSDLGKYIDHMKGKRKIKGKSYKKDLYTVRTEEYWK